MFFKRKEKIYDEALINTQKAYDMWEKIDFQKGPFFCNSNFALIYEEQKDSTRWTEYLHKLISYTGEEKAFIRHYPYMKLGNYHFAKNEKSESKQYYELALKQNFTIAVCKTTTCLVYDPLSSDCKDSI